MLSNTLSRGPSISETCPRVAVNRGMQPQVIIGIIQLDEYFRFREWALQIGSDVVAALTPMKISAVVSSGDRHRNGLKRRIMASS